MGVGKKYVCIYTGLGNGYSCSFFHILLIIILADGGGEGYCVSLAGVEETAGARPAQAKGDGGTTGDN